MKVHLTSTALSLLLMLGVHAGPVDAGPRFSIVDLGVLPGFAKSDAAGINEAGHVVGSSSAANNSTRRAFLWREGTLTDLGALPTGGSNDLSAANSVNRFDQVVGGSAVRVPDPQNGGTVLVTHAFIWQNGIMTDLGAVTASSGPGGSTALAVNDLGQAAGQCLFQPALPHTCLWVNGTPTDLPGLAGPFGDNTALGINNHTQVVGLTNAPGGATAYLWENGVMKPLGMLPGGNASGANAINDAGQVVGFSAVTGGQRHAFLWTNGVMTDLGTLGGTSSAANAINASGQVVGSFVTGGQSRAFLVKDGVMKDLNDLIDPGAGWVLQNASGINRRGQIVGSGLHNGQPRAFLLTPRHPVLIIPGVAATYAADVTNDLAWLIHRGIDPAGLQIDPLAGVYNDLIQTLRNVGYVDGTDLFVVTYDWRLAPGPDDGQIDGVISGITAPAMNGPPFQYGVDYLGLFLRRAVAAWEQDHPGDPLDEVDVIAHSTGGLVTRTYIQSGAYGEAFDGDKRLPKVGTFVMIGVPNRGASKAWNPLHDNWGTDPTFQLVLSKILSRAYEKVLDGTVIAGPQPIDLASITSCPESAPICFINRYVPTLRALLATYDFVDFGAGPTNVNGDASTRNSFLLDLNAGRDLVPVGDALAFADQSNAIAICGTNGETADGAPGMTPPGTPRTVIGRLGPASNALVPFSSFTAQDAGPGESYFVDVQPPESGDGTVPLESCRDLFAGDPRVTVKLFTRNGNTGLDVSHTALPYNTDVQKFILQTLGAPFQDNQISAGLAGTPYTALLNVVLDPVEGFVVDGAGRRLGFTAATGPLTEIPNSKWFGNTDGSGWVFGPLEPPLTLELTGVGQSHHVAVSLLSSTTAGGATNDGILGTGSAQTLAIATQARRSPSRLVAAMLPASRSVPVGAAGTAFVTVLNTDGVPAIQVTLALASGIPAALTYQGTDCATNAPVGTANTPLDIPAGGAQCFVVAITPVGPFSPRDVALTVAGTNTAPVGVLVGINTLLLSGNAGATPDMVALAATASNDGTVTIPGSAGTGAFSVATVNVGAAASITVSADTGEGHPPVAMALCQTNPSTGACLSTLGVTAAVQVNPGDTPTFAIFVLASGDVLFDPAINRVFVRFKDASGVTRGATSVAVRTQ